MSREKALAKNMSIIAIGTFLPKLATFITLPILTGCLTKSEYGTYDLITTLVSLLLPVTTLQIQSAAFRFLIDSRNNKGKINEIITNLMVFTTTTSLISLIILFVFLHQMDTIIRIEISLYLFLDIIMGSIQQIVRGIGKNVWYSTGAVLNVCANTCMIIATVHLKSWGINGVLLSMNVSLLIGILYLSVKLHLLSKIDFKLVSKAQIKKMLSYSWPMVPNNLSNWVLQISDRIVITFFLGVEANAVYAVANKIPHLLKMLQSTFIYAWQENASISVDDSDSDVYYTKMFDVIFCLTGGFMALILAAMPILFRILIKGDYDGAYYQMPILLLGTMFGCISSFIGGIYIAHMKTRSVGITTMFAAVCNLLIDLAFVNTIGIYAGSVSTLVSFTILTIYRMLDVRKFQKIEYNIKKIIVLLIIFTGMTILNLQRNIFLDAANLVIAVAVAIAFNKEILKCVCSITHTKIMRYFNK